MHTSIETDYSAPEILGFVGDGSEESSTYTNAVDMWSLGCVLHWLLTQLLPLKRWDLMPFCLGSRSFPTQHLSKQLVSLQGIDFIQKLMVPKPQGRMSAFEALKHGWPRESFDLNSSSDTADHPSSTPTKTPPAEAEGSARTELPDIAVLQGLEAGDDGYIKDNKGKVFEMISEGSATDLAAVPTNDQGEVLGKDGDVIGRAEVSTQEALANIANENISLAFGNAEHAGVENLADESDSGLRQQISTTDNQAHQPNPTDSSENKLLATSAYFGKRDRESLRKPEYKKERTAKLNDLLKFSKGTASVIKEGHIRCKEDKFLAGWNQRYLILREFRLDFLKNENGKVMQSINLNTVTGLSRSDDTRMAFEVTQIANPKDVAKGQVIDRDLPTKTITCEVINDDEVYRLDQQDP